MEWVFCALARKGLGTWKYIQKRETNPMHLFLIAALIIAAVVLGYVLYEAGLRLPGQAQTPYTDETLREVAGLLVGQENSAKK